MYRASTDAVKLRTPHRSAASCVTCAARRASPLLVVLSLLPLPGRALAQAACPPLAGARSGALSNPAEAGTHDAGGGAVVTCRFDAALTRMFTPPTVPPGMYRVYVTEDSIERMLAEFRGVAASSDVEGAWSVTQMSPLDAYGEAGLYDRAKVARLYGGVPARVARGPILENGRTVASITLVSPHPNGSLARLERGTLIIEFRLPPPTSR